MNSSPTATRICRRPWVAQVNQRAYDRAVTVTLADGWVFMPAQERAITFPTLAAASTGTCRLWVTRTEHIFSHARMRPHMLGCVLEVRKSDSLEWQRVGTFPSLAELTAYAADSYGIDHIETPGAL